MNVAKLADRVIEVLDGKIIDGSEGSLLNSEISIN